METPNYIKALLKPTANKSNSRKVWSIDLETVWLPFFTATNAMNDTVIPHEALGAPLRLAYSQDGSVKFSKSGRPIIKVVKGIADNVRLVRENFIAGLQGYTHEVFTTNEEAYKEQVRQAVEAGQPLKAHDKEKLDEAMAKVIQQALAEAEAKDKAEANEKLVKQALEQAEKVEASTDGTTEAEAQPKGKSNRKPKEKELVTA